MKEQNFDQYVKDLLQNAEVEVSPRVWKGISARMGMQHRPVFPVWGWALASVAAAFVAVVLFRATQQVSPTIPSVSAIMAQTSLPGNRVELLPKQTEAIAAPQGESVIRLKTVTAIASARLDKGRVEGKAQQPSARMRNQVASDKKLASRVDDTQLLNQLAFSDRRQSGDKGFSLLASANFQGNERGHVSQASAFPRPYGAPPAGADEGIYNETPETNFRLPFSIGLGVRYNFTDRWAVGTGIRYTNLGRTFVGDFVSKDGIAISLTDIDNQQHWMGIPVNMFYDIVNRGRWRVHGFLGGAVEYLVVNDFLIHHSPKDLHYRQSGTDPQWSVAGGLGVEFRITPHVGIYLDPNVRYYFDADRQPRSLRTIQPLRFDMEGGLRFTFGEL